MAYSAVPKYKNQFTNYAMIAYGDELMPTIIGGDILNFDIGLRRDKMPIFTIGKNNGVSIIRKGRLVEGSFARFAANGKETQATLLSNINPTKFPKVYELVEHTVTPEEIMYSVRANSSFHNDFPDSQAVDKSQQLIDAGLGDELAFFSRPGIRLSDFNGLNMVLVGIPESSIENEPDKFPEKVLLVKINEIYFQGTSVNITIDNPNVIEQVAFYQKQMHVYIEGPEFIV